MASSSGVMGAANKANAAVNVVSDIAFEAQVERAWWRNVRQVCGLRVVGSEIGAARRRRDPVGRR